MSATWKKRLAIAALALGIAGAVSQAQKAWTFEADLKINLISMEVRIPLEGGDTTVTLTRDDLLSLKMWISDSEGATILHHTGDFSQGAPPVVAVGTARLPEGDYPVRTIVKLQHGSEIITREMQSLLRIDGDGPISIDLAMAP